MIANIPGGRTRSGPPSRHRSACCPRPIPCPGGVSARVTAASSATTRCSTSPRPASAASRSTRAATRSRHPRPGRAGLGEEGSGQERRPKLDGIANVMNVVQPGQDQHRVLARGPAARTAWTPPTRRPSTAAVHARRSRRRLDLQDLHDGRSDGEGARHERRPGVPQRFEARGMARRAGGCPAATPYLLRPERHQHYPAKMSVTDALAQSPNTAFVKTDPVHRRHPPVDMAVATRPALVHRHRLVRFRCQSMATCRSRRTSARSPSAPWVNPLELANVAATLASHGKWWPRPLRSTRSPTARASRCRSRSSCEQVVDPVWLTRSRWR